MSALPQPPELTDELRASLARVADILIPPSDLMPAASEAGVAGDLLDLTVSVRPDLWSRVVALLADCDVQSPQTLVQDLRTDNPRAFDALCELVAGAYFMSDRVRDLIDYRGPEASESLMDIGEFLELIEPVIDRGPCYREIPEE